MVGGGKLATPRFRLGHKTRSRARKTQLLTLGAEYTGEYTQMICTTLIENS